MKHMTPEEVIEYIAALEERIKILEERVENMSEWISQTQSDAEYERQSAINRLYES